jgi:ATP-binding cassette subfamily B protein
MKKIFVNNLILLGYCFKCYPVYFFIKLFSSIFHIVQPVSSILLFKLFLDGIFVKNSFSYCIKIVLVMTTINMAVNILNSIINSWFEPVGNQKILAYMTKQLLNKYIKTDMYKLNNPDFYNKYTQVLNDIPSRSVSLLNILSNFLGNMMAVSTIIGLMASMDPAMIAISLIGVIANLIINPWLNKIGYQSYLERTINERIHGYIKRVFYMVDYIKELKIFSIKDLLLKKYDIANFDLIGTYKKYGKKNILCLFSMCIINIICFAVIFLYLAYKAVRGLFTMGDIGALYNSTQELNSSLTSLFSIIPKLMENSIYIDNYLIFMTDKSVIEIHENNGIIESVDSIIFDKVSFSYVNGKKNLNNINLTIDSNKKIALVGHNGAGKSTFVNLLTRLYDPQEGIIFFNGRDYKELDISKLRSNIFVVFQESQIYAASIAENILMREFRNDVDDQVVFESLQRVGLYDKINTMKNSIHSVLTKEFDDNGVVLSGGEIQRLIIARALVSSAKIIVLDEATSNLDAMAEHEIFNQLIQFVKDKMVIYITHKLSTARMADKIYVLANGTIIEQGTHEELMSFKSTYRDMFLTQAKEYIIGDVYG